MSVTDVVFAEAHDRTAFDGVADLEDRVLLVATAVVNGKQAKAVCAYQPGLRVEAEQAMIRRLEDLAAKDASASTC